MKHISITEVLQGNKYPGRGIIIGKSADNKNAVIAYFIMGRSDNSRNRIFQEIDNGIKTEAFDEEKLVDPSLIIYAPVRTLGELTIVTNGDQTDTICEYIEDGGTFEEALRSRCFEPDAPNFTPRISGILELTEDDFKYKLSILKSENGNGDSCERFFYEYDTPHSGEGRFIHTYECDGNPIPPFEGSPTLISINDSINDFTKEIWESLDNDNKVSLFVRYISLNDGTFETKIINKNE